MRELLRLSYARLKASLISFGLIFILDITIYFFLSLLFNNFVINITSLPFSILSLVNPLKNITIVVQLILYFVLIFCINSFFTLAKLIVLIEGSNTTIVQSLKTTTKHLAEYMLFRLLFGIFTIGLIYLSLPIPLVILLWLFWSMFANLAFIQGYRGGLTPLWYSRAIINTSFMKVLWYSIQLLLIMLPILIIAAVILSGFVDVTSSFLKTSAFSFSLLNEYLIWILLGIPLSGFTLSFNIELYKSLPKPEKFSPSKGWLIASFIGYILLIVVLVFFLYKLL